MCIWMQLFTKQCVQFANSCQVLLTIYVLLIFLELMKHEPSHMVDIDIRYIIVLFFLFYLNGYILYLFLFSRERNMIRCHICSKATRCNKFITYGFRKTCTILMMIFVIFVVISCHSGVKATGTLRLRLEVYKGMEWNGFSRERNGMEWNLKILFGSYKIKEWNGK